MVLPVDIVNYQFDKIIITSMYSVEIKKQLLALGIANDKISIASKKDAKGISPFEDDATFNLARNILKFVCEDALINNEFKFCIEAGTLLGIVRDNNLLRWDCDMDFFIHPDSINQTKCFLLKKFSSFDTNAKIGVIERGGVTGNIVGYVINVASDENYKSFNIDFSYVKFEDEYMYSLFTDCILYSPKLHFDKIDTIVWEGVRLPVPYKHKDYLTFLYGDWKVPKKDFTVEDYANFNETKVSSSSQARFTNKVIFQKNGYLEG